jgi:hypothetical protein
MGAVRTGLLVLYLAGTYFLSGYLQDRRPESSDRRPAPGSEMWRAIFWVWGPTLWMLPGMLWIGLLGIAWPYILILSILIPLCTLSLCLAFTGIFTADPIDLQQPVPASASGFRFPPGKRPSRDLLPATTTIALVLLTLLIVLWVFLMTPDLSLFRFVLFAISLIVPSLTSIWFVAIWARAVILLPDNVTQPTRTALAMVLGYFSGCPRPMWLVEDGKIRTRIKGNAFLGIGPGLVVTEPENAVVLKSGAKLTRVAGPGAVLTEKGEIPLRVVDLRNQMQVRQVDAITRDGIEVRMPVACAFRIARGPEDVKLQVRWPYRRQQDIFRVLFSEEVDRSGRSPVDAYMAHPWEDLPVQIAAHKLEQIISFYSLDQLYAGVTEPEAAQMADHPQHALLTTHRRVEKALGLPASDELAADLSRHTIGQLVVRAVRQAVAPRGIEILGGGVGMAPAPINHGVTEQRVEAWKSRFITKVMDWQASIERQRFEALGKIRQQAREKMLADLIQEMSQHLEAQGPALQRDFVAYHLLDSLIRIARSPDVQKMLPESALPTLEHVYHQVGDAPEIGGER